MPTITMPSSKNGYFDFTASYKKFDPLEMLQSYFGYPMPIKAKLGDRSFKLPSVSGTVTPDGLLEKFFHCKDQSKYLKFQDKVISPDTSFQVLALSEDITPDPDDGYYHVEICCRLNGGVFYTPADEDWLRDTMMASLGQRKFVFSFEAMLDTKKARLEKVNVEMDKLRQERTSLISEVKVMKEVRPHIEDAKEEITANDEDVKHNKRTLAAFKLASAESKLRRAERMVKRLKPADEDDAVDVEPEEKHSSNKKQKGQMGQGFRQRVEEEDSRSEHSGSNHGGSEAGSQDGSNDNGSNDNGSNDNGGHDNGSNDNGSNDSNESRDDDDGGGGGGDPAVLAAQAGMQQLRLRSPPRN